MGKKILIFTSEFPPLPGGIGNHAYNLGKHLCLHDYDVTIIADQRNKNLQSDIDFDSKHDFKVVRIKRKNPVVLTYINRIQKTFSLIRKNEIIIASGKFPLWLVAFMSLFFSSKKFVAVLHGSELGIGGKIGKSLTRFSLRKYDKLIAVSNFTKKLALDRQPNIKIEVINNGFAPKIDVQIAKPKTSGLDIITVGNVTYRKGQQNVIKALPEIQKQFPDVVYHIVGLPTEKMKFAELAKRLNVEKSVIFHGALSDAALYKTLSHSKVFCMLSDYLPNGDVEGFGIAVLEANQLGLPGVGSKNSGIADAINDGFSGKLVDPHNPKEIAQALSEIMNKYDAYSSNAVKWSKNFSWDKIIKKYIAVIANHRDEENAN